MKSKIGGKQRTHSGAKKRIKVKKSGKMFVQKAAKRHLLVNKSDGQKAINVMPVHPTRVKAVRKMLSGVKIRKSFRRTSKSENTDAKKTA